MASRIANLRDSLAEHIADGSPYVIHPITVSTTWFPYLERENLGSKTEVVVAPFDAKQSAAARSSSSFARMEEAIEIAVHVRRNADRLKTSDVDRVAELAEQIMDRVATHVPGTIDDIRFMLRGVVTDPLFDPGELVEYRVFESRIVASYLRVS
jgi:hypothetical protein